MGKSRVRVPHSGVIHQILHLAHAKYLLNSSYSWEGGGVPVIACFSTNRLLEASARRGQCAMLLSCSVVLSWCTLLRCAIWYGVQHQCETQSELQKRCKSASPSVQTTSHLCVRLARRLYNVLRMRPPVASALFSAFSESAFYLQQDVQSADCIQGSTWFISPGTDRTPHHWGGQRRQPQLAQHGYA